MPAALTAGLLLLGSLIPGLRHDPVPASRWGRTGHQVIARIAAARLSPAAAAQVDLLLSGQSMAGASTWADSIRGQRSATGPWHYVNVPLYESAFDREVHCPKSCVISALETQLELLSNRALPIAARGEALKFVIHFVGDMHAPLHVGDRGDRGGNDLMVTWRGRRTNLHSLWDSGLLTALDLPEDDLLARLESQISSLDDLVAITRGSIVDWAMESQVVSRLFVYRHLPDDLALSDGYLNAVRSTMEARLRHAGIRLAALLERALVAP